MRVADIGKMVDLGACLDNCLLDLDEIASLGLFPEVSTRPQAGERANAATGSDCCTLYVAEGVDGDVGGDPHAWPEDDVGFDHLVRPDFRCMLDKDRFIRNHG